MNSNVNGIIIFLLLFVSCKKQSQVEITKLDCVFKMDQFSDSSFFKGVTYINNYQNHIYVSDSYNGRIVKLDDQMNFIAGMGNNGQGPGEFSGVGCSNIYHDTVYSVDYQNLRVNTFSLNGKFIASHKINDYSLTYNGFCVDDKGFLYFNSVLDTMPFVKYDRHMQRQFSFGDWYMPQNKEEKNALNQYHLLYFQNKILCIQRENPQINLYEENGTLLLSKEFDSNIFRNRVNFRKNEHSRQISNKKKMYNLFTSVTSYSNKVFLLYIDHNKDDNRPNCNKIVELSYSNNDFKITNIYQLDPGWYTAICATEKAIICFNDSSCEFQIYNLNT